MNNEEEFEGLSSGEYSCDRKWKIETTLYVKAVVCVADDEKADEFERKLQDLLAEYAI